jgi:8-oxo-dGTP pyrophosphatase MutT (NUDIX family)
LIPLTLSKLIASHQGGIDQREDPRAAAFRELREETGVTSAEMVAEVS